MRLGTANQADGSRTLLGRRNNIQEAVPYYRLAYIIVPVVVVLQCREELVQVQAQSLVSLAVDVGMDGWYG